MNGLALARAKRALVAAGLDPDVALEPASSVTNEVWLSAEHAVRVNRRADARLFREAHLAPFLPAEVRYPGVVAHGTTSNGDWLIAHRRPGRVLSRCWPDLAVPQRRRAIRQLADMLRAVHATPAPADLPALDGAPQLLDAGRGPTCVPLLEAIETAKAFPFVDVGMLDDLAQFVRTNGKVLEPFTSSHLIHGDLTFENMLWDGEDLTALLDFEWARAAPRDLDLDVLLRFCAYPFLHVADDYEHLALSPDYAAVPWWLGEDYPELFDFAHQLERMKVYAIAYDTRQLHLYPPRVAIPQLSDHHPYRRLERVLTGRCHLDRLAVDRA